MHIYISPIPPLSKDRGFLGGGFVMTMSGKIKELNVDIKRIDDRAVSVSLGGSYPQVSIQRVASGGIDVYTSVDGGLVQGMALKGNPDPHIKIEIIIKVVEPEE